MSHLWVQCGLDAGSVNASGAVDPGGCTAQDAVATQIQAILLADSVVCALFQDRVYRFDSLPDKFYGKVPCILITPQALSPTLAPTQKQVGQVDTRIIIVHSAVENRVLEPWEPSVASVMEHVAGVVVGDQTLCVDLQSGPSDFPIARRAEVLDRSEIVPFDTSEGVIVFRETVVRHEVNADHDTGRISGLS